MVEKKLLFSNFSPINLYDSLVNQLKIEHFLPRLCSIVIIVQLPLNSTTTKLHCPMWNSFCTGSEFPSRCVAYCAHKSIQKNSQTMWEPKTAQNYLITKRTEEVLFPWWGCALGLSLKMQFSNFGFSPQFLVHILPKQLLFFDFF